MNVTNHTHSNFDLQKSNSLSSMASSSLTTVESVVSNQAAKLTDTIHDELTLKRANAKLSNRCKRGLIRFWRAPSSRSLPSVRRHPSHLKYCGVNLNLSATGIPSACQSSNDSILRDLQNKFSTLTEELHNIQTRLTQLQHTCTSIQSTLFNMYRPQSSCIPSSTSVYTTTSIAPASQACALTTATTTTTTDMCVTSATAVVIPPVNTASTLVLPQSSSRILPIPIPHSRLTPISVDTGPFDDRDANSLHDLRSRPVSITLDVKTTQCTPAPIPSSSLFSDCTSAISNSFNPENVMLEEILSDPSTKLSQAHRHILQSVYGLNTTKHVDSPAPNDEPNLISTTLPPIPITTDNTSQQETTAVVQLSENPNHKSSSDEVIDTFELVQHVRKMMEHYGVTQRQLARCLPNCSQRIICELLCKPKPWLTLTDRRRQAYCSLKRLFENPKKLTELDRTYIGETMKPEVSNPMCSTIAAQSALILGSTHGTVSIASSSSYSPAPSEPSLDPFAPNKRRRKSTSSTGSTSNYSNADSGSLFGGGESASPGFMLMDELHKQSANDDQDDIPTEKRIANILSAARIAMAKEQYKNNKREAEDIHATLMKPGEMLRDNPHIRAENVSDAIQTSSGGELISTSANAHSGLPPLPVSETLSKCTPNEISPTSIGSTNQTSAFSSMSTVSLPTSTTVPLSQAEAISTVLTSIPQPNQVIQSSMPSMALNTATAAPIMAAPFGAPTPTINGQISSDLISPTSIGSTNQTSAFSSMSTVSLPTSTTVPLSQAGAISTVLTSIPQPNQVIQSSMPPMALSTATAAPIMVAPFGAPTPTINGQISSDLIQFLFTQSCNGMNPVQLAVPCSNLGTPFISPVTVCGPVYLSPSCPTVQTVPMQPSLMVSSSSSSSSLSVPHALRSNSSSVTPTPLGLNPLVVSPMPMNPFEPMGQTLFFLAPSVASDPQIIPSSSDPISGISLPQNKTNHIPSISSKSKAEFQNLELNVASHTNTITLPPEEPSKASTKSEDVSVTKPQVDTSPLSSSDASEICASDSTGQNSFLTYKRPTTEEVIRVTKTLDDLDTDMLRVQVKNVLRKRCLSQRVFGEVILGMCQASVSDMLTKPRPWSQLTEKARLPYVRMYIWLNQLNQMALSCEIPDKSNDTVPSKDNEILPRSNLETVSVESCKRDRPSTPGTSPLGTTAKLMKLEPVCASNAASEKPTPDPILTASDRESLVKIAKAATTAMRRSGSFGSNQCYQSNARGHGSGPTTPTKLNVQPLATMQLNGSDGERDTSLSDGSPLKLSPGRNRVVFSPEQKQALLAEFARQPYPSTESLRALSRQLNLPFKPVVNWFHNRRMRSRQRLPITTAFEDHATENIINDLTTSVLCPELPGRECSEDFSTVAVTAPSTVTQVSRRKRPDPTRFSAGCTTNVSNSYESNLSDPIPTNSLV